MTSQTMQGVDTAKAPSRSEWLFQGACSIEQKPFLTNDVDKCKDVCSHCPVKDLCLEYALANDEKYGVWGGLSRPERLKVLRMNRPNLLHVPLEYRDHWKELNVQVTRTPKEYLPPVPKPRDPALDYQIPQDFLDLLAAIDDA